MSDVGSDNSGRAYLGEGITEDGLEGVLNLVDAGALLEVADDSGDASDERALLLGCRGS